MEDTLTAVYRAEIDDFLRGTNRVQNSFSNMRAVSVWSMARVGDAVLNAGRKVFAFGVDVVKSGQEFEQAIAGMRSVLPQNDQVGESFDRLNDKIRELGSTTTFTAVEAAEAATFLAMAGLNAAEAVEALPATLQLASAGGLDLGKAADIATNAMSGFGMGADKLQRIVDTLAITAASSNTDIRGLGSAFSFVAATATGLGVSLESTSAGIAALGNVGIQAGRAGRNLSGLFSELAKKGEGLGLKIFKANGDLKNLSEILEAVKASGMGTNDIIQEFGAITSRTLIALMQTGSEEVAKFEAKFRASGVTIENVGEIAEATGVSVEFLQQSLEGTSKTQEALGVTTTDTTSLLLALSKAGFESAEATDAVNLGLAQLADGAHKAGVDIFTANGNLLNFNKLVKDLGVESMTTEEIVETFGEEGAKVIAAMTSTGADGFGELSGKVREFVGEAEGAAAVMQDTKTDTLEGDLKRLGSAFADLKLAITETGLNEVIREIVQGITSLLGEAIKFVEENKEAIDSFFNDLASKVGPVIQQLKPQVIPVLTAIGESFAELTTRSIAFISNMVRNKDTLSSIFSGISQGASVLREVFFTLLEAFAAMPAPMQKLVIGAVAISATMGPLLTLIAGFASGLTALVGVLVPATASASGIGAVLAGLMGPVTLITAAVVGLAAAFATNFGGIRDKVREAWDKIASKFGEGEQSFADLKVALEALWMSFEQVFELVMDLVIDVVATIVTALINFGKTVGDVVNIVASLLKGDFKGAWDAAKSLVQNSVTFFIELFEDLIVTFINLGENIVKGLGEGIRNSFNKARETVTNLADNVLGWFKSALGIRSPALEFIKAGEEIVNGLTEGIRAKHDDATKAAKELAKELQAAFNQQMQALKANVDLGIIDVESARAALVEMEQLLDAELQKFAEVGDNGSAAFLEIAKAATQVKSEIQAIDKAAEESTKKAEQEAQRRIDIAKQEAVNAIQEADKAHRHKLALGEITTEQHLDWLAQQLAASAGNVERQRALELEIFNITKQRQEEQTRIAEEEAKKRAEVEAEAARKAVEEAEKVHRHRLALKEIDIQEHIKWLNEQLAANIDNAEKRRAIELELFNITSQLDKEAADAAAANAKKAVEEAEAVHRHKLALGEIGLDEHLRWLDEQLAATIDNAAKQRALEKEKFDLIEQREEERTRKAKEEADKRIAEAAKQAAAEIKEADAAHRHEVELGRKSLAEHQAWLAAQIVLSEGDAERQRKLEKELFDTVKKLQEEATKVVEEEAKKQAEAAKNSAEKQAEAAKKSAKEREEAAKNLAKIAKEAEEEIHKAQLDANQATLQDYIDNLKSRAAALEMQGQTESEEYRLLQERLTEADREFKDNRVALAIEETEQKLAQAEITKAEYVAKLQELMQDENTSIDDRIKLATKLADFKRSEFKTLSEDEIKFLQNVLEKEELTAKEVEDLTKALTGLIKDNAKDREDAEKRANKNAEDHAKKTSKEIKEAWERDTKAIIGGFFDIADGLRDISPVASEVFNLIGSFAENLVEKLEEVGASAFGVADALGAIGSAAQGSSSIAVKAVGGLASAIGNFMSGNIIGGVVSGVSTVIGAIGGIFSRGRRRAKKFQEQLQKMKAFMQGLADTFKGLEIFGTVSAAGIEFNVKDLLGEDKVLTDLQDFEKDFLNRIFDLRKRVGQALEGLSKDLKEKFGNVFGKIELGSGAAFGENSAKVVSKASEIAGDLVAEIVRLEDELAQAFRERVGGGLQGQIENELLAVVERLEFWGTQFERATEALGSGFTDALTEVFVEGTSIKEAGEGLRKNFNRFIIETIFDLATKAALANTLIAAQMADLVVLIQKAFETGEWQPAKDAIKTLTKDLDKAFRELSDTVGEAVSELGLEVDATVNPDTAGPVDVDANVTVNLDEEGVEEFNVGVEKLSFFGRQWTQGIEKFGMNVQQLTGQFLPDLDVFGNQFGVHVQGFGHSVTSFRASVITHENTVNRELTGKTELMTKFSEAVETIERAANNLAFSDIGKIT